MEGQWRIWMKWGNGRDMDVVGVMECIWMLCGEWTGYGCCDGNGGL